MNAANLEHIKEATRKGKSQRERELLDLQSVLSQKEGRRFVWRFLILGGIFETSFTGNSTTFFKEGARNLALQVLADVNEACPDMYLEMMKENKKGE